MAKRNKENRGCLGNFTWVIVSLVLMFCITGYGLSQGIDVPGLFSSLFHIGVKGEKASTDDIDSFVSRFIGRTEPSSLDKPGIDIKSDTVQETKTEVRYQPLSFANQKQMVNGELDALGRATYGHIQLRYADKPKEQREGKITVDPVGWHNYRFKYEDEKGKVKKAYLMNRGHLIGYQFSGLNSEIKNLVPMTRYLNAGTIADSKMDDTNPYGMLFYENALAKWLKENPDLFLDYKVTPNYTGDELIPRTVTLYWTAIDTAGVLHPVTLNDNGQATTEGTITSVTLYNTSLNATINYLDGTATSHY